MFEVLVSRLEPDTKKHVSSHRMIAVVRLDGGRQRVRGEVYADAGFHVAEQLDIASVPDRVGANPKRAAVRFREMIFNLRLTVKQLVFVYQLRAARDEVPAAGR